MKRNVSAGLLLYNLQPSLQVLLGHPGGPYFAKKDMGSWSIPKGLADAGDSDLLLTAQREFVEETGFDLSDVQEYLPLGSVQLKSGKEVHAWAFQGEWEARRVPQSNTFEIEWPPRSGRRQVFPEIDRAEMFTVSVALDKINERQRPFLARLAEQLGQADEVASPR